MIRIGTDRDHVVDVIGPIHCGAHGIVHPLHQVCLIQSVGAGILAGIVVQAQLSGGVEPHAIDGMAQYHLVGIVDILLPHIGGHHTVVGTGGNILDLCDPLIVVTHRSHHIPQEGRTEFHCQVDLLAILVCAHSLPVGHSAAPETPGLIGRLAAHFKEAEVTAGGQVQYPGKVTAVVGIVIESQIQILTGHGVVGIAGDDGGILAAALVAQGVVAAPGHAGAVGAQGQGVVSARGDHDHIPQLTLSGVEQTALAFAHSGSTRRHTDGLEGVFLLVIGVAQLPGGVVTPGQHPAVLGHGKGEPVSGGDIDDPFQAALSPQRTAAGNLILTDSAVDALGVAAVAVIMAVEFYRHASAAGEAFAAGAAGYPCLAGSSAHVADQACSYPVGQATDAAHILVAQLAPVVAAPSVDHAVLIQGHSKIGPGGDGHDISQIFTCQQAVAAGSQGAGIVLSALAGGPAAFGAAVAAQYLGRRQPSHRIAQAQLSKAVVAPGPDSTVRLQADGKAVARRDLGSGHLCPGGHQHPEKTVLAGKVGIILIAHHLHQYGGLAKVDGSDGQDPSIDLGGHNAVIAGPGPEIGGGQIPEPTVVIMVGGVFVKEPEAGRHTPVHLGTVHRHRLRRGGIVPDGQDILGILSPYFFHTAQGNVLTDIQIIVVIRAHPVGIIPVGRIVVTGGGLHSHSRDKRQTAAAVGRQGTAVIAVTQTGILSTDIALVAGDNHVHLACGGVVVGRSPVIHARHIAAQLAGGVEAHGIHGAVDPLDQGMAAAEGHREDLVHLGRTHIGIIVIDVGTLIIVSALPNGLGIVPFPDLPLIGTHLVLGFPRAVQAVDVGDICRICKAKMLAKGVHVHRLFPTGSRDMGGSLQYLVGLSIPGLGIAVVAPGEDLVIPGDGNTAHAAQVHIGDAPEIAVLGCKAFSLYDVVGSIDLIGAVGAHAGLGAFVPAPDHHAAVHTQRTHDAVIRRQLHHLVQIPVLIDAVQGVGYISGLELLGSVGGIPILVRVEQNGDKAVTQKEVADVSATGEGDSLLVIRHGDGVGIVVQTKAPAVHMAVVGQRQTMVVACGDLLHVGKSHRLGDLLAIHQPGHLGHDLGGIGVIDGIASGAVAQLALIVPAPGPNGAVRLQGQRELLAAVGHGSRHVVAPSYCHRDLAHILVGLVIGGNGGASIDAVAVGGDHAVGIHRHQPLVRGAVGYHGHGGLGVDMVLLTDLIDPEALGIIADQAIYYLALALVQGKEASLLAVNLHDQQVQILVAHPHRTLGGPILLRRHIERGLAGIGGNGGGILVAPLSIFVAARHPDLAVIGQVSDLVSADGQGGHLY